MLERSYITHLADTIILPGLLLLSLPAIADSGQWTDGDMAGKIIESTCAAPALQPALLANALGTDDPGPPEVIEARGRRVGERSRLAVRDRRITIERIAHNGRLATVRVFIHGRNEQPHLFVGTDGQCRIRMARAVLYSDDGRVTALQPLDGQLAPIGDAELLDADVPAGTDHGGVRIAMVDSGVNYLLPQIASRLARDGTGNLIGFDFWDMDPRPFDNHPVPSVFFAQRHGTRTAALALREAPHATLVPYRYPRPDMTRMRDLVAHAAQHQVRIIGLPLGGNRGSEWRTFADAAAEHPDILFIASAGNSGRDIDQDPVYPAALSLANMLVVSSAGDRIRPAEGTNWGPNSVQLLVPAERQMTVDFDGQQREVSGSSYAVARLVALAAELAHQNPHWRAPQLRAALLQRALALPHLKKFVSSGYIPDPVLRPGEITPVRTRTLALPVRAEKLSLRLDLAQLEETGWNAKMIEDMVVGADQVLGQCGITLDPVILHELRVSPRLRDFDVHTAHSLVTQLSVDGPVIYLIRDTRRENGFEGEAFGRDNSQTRPWLRNTIWLVADVDQPAVALAHELFHVISNSGLHSTLENNLMNTRTQPNATFLSEEQCVSLRKNGRNADLLTTRRDH